MLKSTLTPLLFTLTFCLFAQSQDKKNLGPIDGKSLELQLGAGIDYMIFGKVSGHINYHLLKKRKVRVVLANELSFTHFLFDAKAFWYPSIKMENKLPGGFWLTSSAGPEWSKDVYLPDALRMEWFDEDGDYQVRRSVERHSTRIDVGLKKYLGKLSLEFSTPFRFGQRQFQGNYYPGIQTRMGWLF